MDEHVKELLGAYLDGELESRAYYQVREHLDGCRECRAELAGLIKLSRLLQNTSVPGNMTSAAAFAARLESSLPERHPLPEARLPARIGWWLIPIMLISAWIFIQTASLMTSIIVAAHSAGLLGTMGNLLPSASAGSISENPILLLLSGAFSRDIGSILTLGLSAWQEVGGFLAGLTWQLIPPILYIAWLVAVWFSKSNPMHNPETSGAILRS